MTQNDKADSWTSTFSGVVLAGFNGEPWNTLTCALPVDCWLKWWRTFFFFTFSSWFTGDSNLVHVHTSTFFPLIYKSRNLHGKQTRFTHHIQVDILSELFLKALCGMIMALPYSIRCIRSCRIYLFICSFLPLVPRPFKHQSTNLWHVHKNKFRTLFSVHVNYVYVPEHETFTPEHKRSSAGQRLCEMCLELHLVF